MAFGGENAESYYDDGLTLAMKGELTKALQCFEKAIRLDRKYLAAYHQLGKTYARLGDYDKAVHLLHEVLNRKPNLVPARLDYGYALLGAGRPQEARQQFEQLTTLDPANTRANLALGHALFHLKDWNGAMAQAQSALQESGNNLSALFLQGRAASLAGNQQLSGEALERADKLIEKSSELTPDQPENHYLRGEVAFARDQFGSALEHYRAAEDRAREGQFYGAFGENFTLASILGKQGLCYQRLGKHDRAREIGVNIVKRWPDDALGQALAKSEP
ncbi:MAG: tetratricopeptide repeat protein [Candidatus Hydrogenedentes bacterium]|nr:tetratricopeptide repeat protein [Candidatus Hydrogenedentota bacterium]